MLGAIITTTYDHEIAVALSIISGVLTLLTFLPFIRSDYWTFRALEYPRFQKMVACLLVLCLWAVLWPVSETYHWVMIGLLLISTIYLIYKVIPYTPLYPKEMMRVGVKDKANTLKVFTANVLQDNEQYDKMLAQVRHYQPDLVFLVEADTKWQKAMDVLKETHPHTLARAIDNTYGLLLYSRLPFDEGSVLFRVKNDIPSVELVLILPSGQRIKVYGLHPEPPAPNESLTTTAKDKELMLVAFEIRKCKDPVIVMGDLNDVAWSYTTELFRKTSNLLDPRRGRGFFSTFSANSKIMRFPLDYIFCSDHFGLVEMKRMPFNGSDHFAMYVHLQYDEQLHHEQEATHADADELEDAQEKAKGG